MCVYARAAVESEGFLCPDEVPVLVRYGEVAACRDSDEATKQATDAVREAADANGLGEVGTQDRWANPYFGDPRRAQAGQKAFAKRCAGCHGPDAQVDPLGVSEGNLGVSVREGIGDQEIVDIVRQGRLSMPDFRLETLSDDELWEIVTFLRSTR